MSIEPKKENANVGFYYTVTQEQIDAHLKRTPEERERMKKAKQFKW